MRTSAPWSDRAVLTDPLSPQQEQNGNGLMSPSGDTEGGKGDSPQGTIPGMISTTGREELAPHWGQARETVGRPLSFKGRGLAPHQGGAR